MMEGIPDSEHRSAWEDFQVQWNGHHIIDGFTNVNDRSKFEHKSSPVDHDDPEDDGESTVIHIEFFWWLLL